MMKPGKMNCVIWILTIGEQEKRDKISHIAVLETQWWHQEATYRAVNRVFG